MGLREARIIWRGVIVKEDERVDVLRWLGEVPIGAYTYLFS